MSRRANRRRAAPSAANLYVAGADVRLRVEDADGAAQWRAFRLLRYGGGGFSADVWQARDVQTGCLYALKLFAAQRGLLNRCKKRLRDLAHLLWFQSAYPYRTCQAAVRHALLVRKLLHALSIVTDGAPSVVDAEGCFWEPAHRTYGLVLEWVEGRAPRYRRPLAHDTPRWLSRQRRWMAFARRWGFPEHAGQVYAGRRWGGAWFSLANVAYAVDASGDESRLPASGDRRGQAGRFDPRRLRWVDLEPGVPHVVWCFWFHVRLAASAWRRGVFPSFDRVDAMTLSRALLALDDRTRRRWAGTLTEVAGWCARLGQARRQYDRQRFNIWQHRWRLFADGALRRDIREGLLAYWRQSDQISSRGYCHLTRHRWAWCLAWGLGLVPVLGGFVRRYCWHERFRRQADRLLNDATYALRLWRHGARIRLWVWRQEGRLPSGGTAAPILAWCSHAWRAAVLPAAWHRWTSDARYRARWRGNVRRFLWNLQGYRQQVYRRFFLRMLEEERVRHQLDPAEHRRLAAAVQRPALACYLEGHYLYVLPKALFWPLVLALAAFGLAVRAPAFVVGALLLGGCYRECVTWWLRVRHPRVPLGLALATAWLPKVGSLACTVQMARGLRRGERQLLFISLRRLVTAASRLVPFLGGEGTLLEYYAVRLCLDVPYALWRRAGARPASAALPACSTGG